MGRIESGLGGVSRFPKTQTPVDALQKGALAAVTALLVACGGGGGGTADATIPDSDTPPSIPTVPTTPTTQNVIDKGGPADVAVGPNGREFTGLNLGTKLDRQDATFAGCYVVRASDGTATINIIPEKNVAGSQVCYFSWTTIDPTTQIEYLIQMNVDTTPPVVSVNPKFSHIAWFRGDALEIDGGKVGTTIDINLYEVLNTNKSIVTWSIVPDSINGLPGDGSMTWDSTTGVLSILPISGGGHIKIQVKDDLGNSTTLPVEIKRTPDQPKEPSITPPSSGPCPSGTTSVGRSCVPSL